MAADGIISIDTKIQTAGMNTGVKAISNSFDGLRGTVRKTTQSLAQAFLGGKNFATIFKNIAKFSAAALIGGSLISSIRNLAGSFDLASSSIGDKVKPLSAALETLKGTFINLILTAFVPIIPHLINFATWLTKILMTVTQVVAALFGFKKTVGSVMTSAAAGAKKVAKEARGALAAFDQINLLQKPESPGAESGAGTTPAPIIVPQELLDKVEALKKKVLDFLQPAIELFGKLKKIVTESWEVISTWIKDNPEKFKLFLIILGLVILAFIAVAAVVWLVTTAMAIAATVTAAFAAVMAFLASPVILIIAIIAALIIAIILLVKNWDWVKERGVEAWHNIKEIWKFAAEWFIAHVVDPIRAGFSKALDWIKDKFYTVFSSIKDFVRDVIDGIIGYISSLVQSVVDGIAQISGLGGGSGSIGGAVNMRIPHLATGAVIPPNAAFAAILGDQRSGRNIEAPENLIRQIMREELGGSGEVSVTLPVYLDGEKIYQNQKKINTRHGKNLVK